MSEREYYDWARAVELRERAERMRRLLRRRGRAKKRAAQNAAALAIVNGGRGR